ncbi:Maf family protein [Riemerella anatipestifer]|uniref:dTTP/UTP pyrophosphatase n=1 Tax=Riemerella anatipestifer (strain ATCC 11845 / DSM 15868 / JCM 9532 / NCTC 11014) TaxID=693978 RepID=E4TC22_RIEAD|nr:Maf family protein [Riemerella anatipestifer]ADQ82069.1 maf protein [Riemerella anatipestifer ATCC 11845 = DSM 15868]ADZ12431.1 Nucleotide-binding protein implicated in inhibition of septum formation [Riemerella anatipestifer RA-GD]AFD56071.1 maf protein [Riemerella anatipestifer ATCC 11845 = DSM 15868]AGC40015.1 Nucleotide-binding protein implicated in inhibition of septum formation [Riemerella anatipestifer RA-CH-2]AKP69290.1 maf protein [Riemerella anatipestifer]
MKLYLASQSPRRKELLNQLGFDFEIVSINCDEIYPSDLEIDKVAGFLSELKANAFRPLSEGEVLLTADTIVTFDNKVLGKPKNEAEAKKMLKRLSDNSHNVYTSVCIKTSTKTLTLTDKSTVYFSHLTDEEISYYIENYKPYDKAGAYGIQEWLGMAKIEKVEGSFYTIMGLPTHLVYQQLSALNTILSVKK